jgi:hypothetical protein
VRAAFNGTKAETKAKILSQPSCQKFQANPIEATRKKLCFGGVMKLHNVDNDGTIMELHTKDEIEEAFFEENNGGYFSQSELTPPMQHPLLQDFGYLADTTAAKAVLNGTYEPPAGTDPYAIKILAPHHETTGCYHKCSAPFSSYLIDITH